MGANGNTGKQAGHAKPWPELARAGKMRHLSLSAKISLRYKDSPG